MRAQNFYFAPAKKHGETLALSEKRAFAGCAGAKYLFFSPSPSDGRKEQERKVMRGRRLVILRPHQFCARISERGFYPERRSEAGQPAFHWTGVSS
jgi:hypothetical protein